MRSIVFFSLFYLIPTISFSQDTFEWTLSRPLNLSDFQAKRSTTSGDIIFIQSSARIGFEVSMSNYEFILTKNFNSKVYCTFSPKSAVLIAQDENSAKKLLKFAQYHFDVNELYARKFRKLLFENKGTFSDIKFMHPLFEQNQEELTERVTEAGELTNLGMDEDLLLSLHLKVLDELKELNDFCKTCKPPKVKKIKN